MSSGTWPSGVEHRAQPAPHAVDGRGQLGDRSPHPASRPSPLARSRSATSIEVGQDLAVIGGRALVVAAVGQDLPGQLPGQPAHGQPQQPLVGEEDGQAGQGLEALDQVVAADVVLQVAAQETRVSREPGDEVRFDVAASCEITVQAAP